MSKVAADLLMVKAFVDKVKSNNPIGDNADNPLDIALSIWIDSKSVIAKEHKGRLSKILSEVSLKFLQEHEMVEAFKNTIRPDNHLQNAKALVNFIRDRGHNESLLLDSKTWQHHRNWYYSTCASNRTDVQDKVKQVFADLGFPGLEKAGLNSNQLRHLIYADQIVRWVAHNKRLPKTKGSYTETKMANLLDSQLHPFVRNFLEKNGVKVQGKVATNALPVQLPSNGDQLTRIETMLEQLIDLLQKKEKPPKKKTVRNWSSQFPMSGYKKNLPESDIVGLAVLQDSDGNLKTVGIQNILNYQTGSKKYIFRVPQPDGTYGQTIYRWSTSSDIKEITMLK